MRPSRTGVIVLFLLVVPGAAASVLPVRAVPGGLAWRVFLALPMILLPTLLALTRLQRHQRRAAFGLGARWMDQLRWIWLPQLGPGVLASLALLALFAAAGHRAG